jgi:hypothetical protein
MIGTRAEAFSIQLDCVRIFSPRRIAGPPGYLLDRICFHRTISVRRGNRRDENRILAAVKTEFVFSR